MACIFCAIVAGDAPASMVDTTERAIAFMDIRPVNDGHVLVIPRVHAERVRDLDIDSWRAVGDLVHALQPALYRADGFRCDALNLYVADGEIAGQEVFHVHVHIVPRYDGDGFGLRFPPGYGRTPSRTDLDAIAASLHSAL